MKRILIAATLAIGLAVPIGGCAFLQGIGIGSPTLTQAQLDSQAKAVANAELVYTALGTVAVEYKDCGRPGHLPCLSGTAPDPNIVAQIRAFDAAAYAALQEARGHVNNHTDAASSLALLGTTLAAFTAYEAAHNMKGIAP